MKVTREKERRNIGLMYNSLVKFWEYIKENKEICNPSFQRDEGRSLRKDFKDYLSITKHFNKEDELAEKQATYDYYRKNSEDGFTVMVTEGMDCDGVQYRHISEPIPLVPVKIDKAIDIAYEWNDGSMREYFVKPSVAEKMQNVSIDRGMEAFENGHSHTYRMGSI